MIPRSLALGLPDLIALVLSMMMVSPASAALAATSPKRGLVFTPRPEWPQDNYLWPRQTDLTWYYNYGATPSPVFNNVSQDAFEFVPMLWGAPADHSDTTFLQDVKGLVAKGVAIKHVMGFNEPDGPTQQGGSDVDPAVAAQVWVNNIMPLQDMGIKVGLPACTGGWGGVPWLTQMLGNCSKIISSGGKKKNCTYDYVPIHWYGNFEGLASHIGTYSAAFPNTSIWVTEYNFDNQDLASTQKFYNDSSSYMDRLDTIGRYSLFGAFRSKASNVGPNGAMLSNGGDFTDIGAWYLGKQARGVAPDSGNSGAPSGLRNMWPTAWTVAVAAAAALALGS